MNLLAFGGLEVTRGDRILLRGLGGQVSAGEALQVQGANGAGKTSLLEVLAGLRRPAAGILQIPEPEACHWLGHRNGLSAALTPLENLRFWCRLQGIDGGDVATALARLGLASMAGRPCHALSAGQNRRTALARLLVTRRPLWLLDEPLAALDAAGIELFFSALREHLGAGGAAVLSSHQALPELPGLRRLELP